MSTDFENGLRKTIDLSVRSREFTVDTLKSAMQDFLSGKSQRKRQSFHEKAIGAFRQAGKRGDQRH